MGKRLGDIDLLRGYAVAIVVFFHMSRLDPLPPLFARSALFYTDMSTGVDLFFVISGFVISMTLSPLWRVCTVDDSLALKNVPLRFYHKRFVRLWPPCAFWLVVNLVLDIIFQGQPNWPPISLTLYKLISGFGYLYNFQEYGANSALGYMWSLSVEWQFYLALPLLLLFLRRDSHRILFLLGVYALFVYLSPGGDLWWLFRFDGIVFGIILYMLLARLKIDVPRYSTLSHPVGRVVVTLFLLAAICTAPKFLPGGRLNFIAVNGFGALIVALAAGDRRAVSSLGLGSLIRWVGSRSYSIYLCHIPVILTLLSLEGKWDAHAGLLPEPEKYNIVFFLAGTGAIAIVTEATYRFLERPSHQRSQKIALLSNDEGVSLAAEESGRISSAA